MWLLDNLNSLKKFNSSYLKKLYIFGKKKTVVDLTNKIMVVKTMVYMITIYMYLYNSYDYMAI